MPLHLLISLLLLCGGLLMSGCINTKARPMLIPCALSKASFTDECSRLLTGAGYKIVEANPDGARVRATKNQVQLNQGENMPYNGPYLFDATYSEGSTIIVTVATTIRASSPDEQPVILQTHNESKGTSAADKQYFEPIMRGLRKACAVKP